MHRTFSLLLTLNGLFSIGAIGFADEHTSDAEKPATKLSGVFEAVDEYPISAGFDQLKSLVVKKVVPHGSLVQKGQSLIWFKTEPVDDQIKEAKVQLRLAELTMEGDNFASAQFLETQKLDREAAERVRAAAQQAFDNFVQQDRERQIATANFNLKSSEDSLANAVEELKQLEQMYKEDDLTEESEEIVLKRAKRSVESAQFRLEGAQIQTERTLTQTIPTADAEQKEKLARAELTYQKALDDLESARKRREIEMSQKREKLGKQTDDLKQLREERNSLVLRAEEEGVFYHGALNRGKVSDKPSTLKAGSTATNDQVLATLARSGRLRIRIDVPEKMLRRVSAGARATVKPTSFDGKVLEGKVRSIAATPFVNGKFDCVVDVDLEGLSVVPGMTCEVEILTDESE